MNSEYMWSIIYTAVLVLAEIELIYFIVVSMGLCFGLGLETVHNTEIFLLLLGNACTELRSFVLLTPPANRLEMHKEL